MTTEALTAIKAALVDIPVYGGEWEVGELLEKRRGLSDAFELQNDEDIFGYVYCGQNDPAEVRPVVDFISACNPSAISSLLSSYEAMERRVAELEEALKPFVTTWADEYGWSDTACQKDRIVDWFGPSDFRRAATSLSQSQTVGTPAPETHTAGWRDISTAPDGASILLRLSNGEVFSGWGQTENDGSRTWKRFHATSADVGWLNAKHWSPMLPEPGTPANTAPQTNMER